VSINLLDSISMSTPKELLYMSYVHVSAPATTISRSYWKHGK